MQSRTVLTWYKVMDCQSYTFLRLCFVRFTQQKNALCWKKILAALCFLMLNSSDFHFCISACISLLVPASGSRSLVVGSDGLAKLMSAFTNTKISRPFLLQQRANSPCSSHLSVKRYKRCKELCAAVSLLPQSILLQCSYLAWDIWTKSSTFT